MSTDRKPLHPCQGCGALIKAGKKWCRPCSADALVRSRVRHLQRQKAKSTEGKTQEKE